MLSGTNFRSEGKTISLIRNLTIVEMTLLLIECLMRRERRVIEDTQRCKIKEDREEISKREIEEPFKKEVVQTPQNNPSVIIQKGEIPHIQTSNRAAKARICKIKYS